MIYLTYLTMLSNADATVRAGIDWAPMHQKNVIEVMDAEFNGIAARLNLGPGAIRPFIGWESRYGRIDFRGDFSWDQTDSWVEADHSHNHFGLLRLRLDYQKRINQKAAISPTIGMGLRWDQGFADMSSTSTTSEEIDNALVLTEEIKAELNKLGLIGSVGVEWGVQPNIQLGFRVDFGILIRKKESETTGVSRRLTVENDAVVTCGWKF